MSLRNIALPAVVIAGLYKKNVIQGDAAEVASTLPAAVQEVAPQAAQPVSVVQPQTPAVADMKAPVETVAAVLPVATAPIYTEQTTPSQPVAEPITASKTASISPNTSAPPPAPGTAYKFLGNNKQQVVIVVRFPGEAFMPEAHLQMLSKMLGACKLNLGDVAIVNDATLRVEINALKEQLHPKKLLLFGLEPNETGLPLHFPAFKDQEYAGCVYLHAPSLHELNQENEDGKVLKRKLWESLKKIFGV